MYTKQILAKLYLVMCPGRAPSPSDGRVNVSVQNTPYRSPQSVGSITVAVDWNELFVRQLKPFLFLTSQQA